MDGIIRTSVMFPTAKENECMELVAADVSIVASSSTDVFGGGGVSVFVLLYRSEV